MKEEIIRLCSEVKNNDKCNGCGGDFDNHTCRYCGNDSQILTALISELCSKLVNLTSFDNDMLNALYSIRNMNIKVVNDLIKQNNYGEELEERYKDILSKMSIDKLGKADYHYIIYFLDNNLFLGDNRNKYINFLMKKLLINDLDISIDEILILIKNFVEMYMRVKVKNPKCVFDSLDENVLGESLWSRIWLDKEKIIELIRTKNYIQMLELLFHECAHTYQKYLLHVEKEFSYGALKMAKEELIRCQIPSYYGENYERYCTEVDARYCGAAFTKQYLDALGLSISDSNYFDKIMNREIILLNDETRTINGVETTIDEAFSMYVVDARCLDNNPILKVQYKNNNGKLEMKTYEEIMSDYEKYRSGELKLGGNDIYIQSLYDYLLGSSKPRSVGI